MKWLRKRFWWFTFNPIGRCVWCGKLFWREWPWTSMEEVCSKECNDSEWRWVEKTHG